jgi:phosphoribosylformimino-5-aminoimidazole carboxamide ribotide isomerase
MLVVPVLDLMGGQVVRAIGGRRYAYQPNVSRVACDARPTTVARGLIETFGFTTFYVADLDAIAGAEPAWTVYEELHGLGIDLWIDAGCKNLHSDRGSVVVGLESISRLDSLGELIDSVGLDRCIFSLDLKDGRPLTTELDALTIVREVLEVGLRRLIVLDLAKVGESSGVGTESLCREIRAMSSDVQLFAGGGVRSIDDLRSLSDAGCDGALVASALHDGRMTAEEVRSVGHFQTGSRFS